MRCLFAAINTRDHIAAALVPLSSNWAQRLRYRRAPQTSASDSEEELRAGFLKNWAKDKDKMCHHQLTN